MIDKDGASLQTWGIVQNLSGEDWTNVSLSLIAEAPLAFDASLGRAVVPPRPQITDGGEVMAVVPHSEDRLAGAGARRHRRAAAPSAAMAPQAADRHGPAGRRGRSDGGASAGPATAR